MKPLYRGIAVAVFQCLLVLTVAGKYALDRQSLPRGWARALPVDPNMPLRGRYVSLNLELDGLAQEQGEFCEVTLRAWGGRLIASHGPSTAGLHAARWNGGPWRLTDPVDFFISEHAPDPSFRKPGEELWVEVSVPQRGEPRPIRLAVKKDGVLTPLDLR